MTKKESAALKQRVLERVEKLLIKVMSWEDKANLRGDFGVVRNFRDVRTSLKELMRKEFGVEIDILSLSRQPLGIGRKPVPSTEIYIRELECGGDNDDT